MKKLLLFLIIVSQVALGADEKYNNGIAKNILDFVRRQYIKVQDLANDSRVTSIFMKEKKQTPAAFARTRLEELNNLAQSFNSGSISFDDFCTTTELAIKDLERLRNEVEHHRAECELALASGAVDLLNEFAQKGFLIQVITEIKGNKPVDIARFKGQKLNELFYGLTTRLLNPHQVSLQAKAINEDTQNLVKIAQRKAPNVFEAIRDRRRASITNTVEKRMIYDRRTSI